MKHTKPSTKYFNSFIYKQAIINDHELTTLSFSWLTSFCLKIDVNLFENKRGYFICPLPMLHRYWNSFMDIFRHIFRQIYNWRFLSLQLKYVIIKLLLLCMQKHDPLIDFLCSWRHIRNMCILLDKHFSQLALEFLSDHELKLTLDDFKQKKMQDNGFTTITYLNTSRKT